MPMPSSLLLSLALADACVAATSCSGDGGGGDVSDVNCSDTVCDLSGYTVQMHLWEKANTLHNV